MVPVRDQAVLCAASRWYQRQTGGNWSTSGSRLSRISLTSCSLGFQRSGSRGSSMPGNPISSATDLVPRACLATQTANLEVGGFWDCLVPLLLGAAPQRGVQLIQRRQGRDDFRFDRSLGGEFAEEPGGGDATVHEHVA